MECARDLRPNFKLSDRKAMGDCEAAFMAKWHTSLTVAISILLMLDGRDQLGHIPKDRHGTGVLMSHCLTNSNLMGGGRGRIKDNYAFIRIPF